MSIKDTNYRIHCLKIELSELQNKIIGTGNLELTLELKSRF